MAFLQSAGPAYRLEIVPAAAEAYRTVLDNTRLAVNLAWLPFAIVVAAEVVAALAGGGGFLGRAFAALVHGIGYLVFGTVFIVRWHRFVLLGERSVGALFTPEWRGFVWVGVKLTAAMVVGWIVLAIIALLPPHVITLPLSILGMIALAIGAIRVSLVFPAAAIDRPMSFRAAWDLLAGNYWRLFGAAVLCWLPFAIGQYVLSRIGVALPFILWILFDAAALAVAFAGVAVLTALVSDAYRRLSGPVPGGLASAA